jgi:membrane-bound lytic murein transglycosylase D
VIRGETLTAIASAYGVPAKTLAKMNGLKANRRPRVGSVLVVPIGSLARRNADAGALAMASVEEPTRRKSSAATRLAKANAVKGSKVTSRDAKGREKVKVRPGDSLWSIARRFDVSLEDLARWNGIRRPSKHTLKAGHTLIVYPNTGANRARPVASAR